MKRITLAERKFANRVLRLAVARATRGGDVHANQRELWRIVVAASHKGQPK